MMKQSYGEYSRSSKARKSAPPRTLDVQIYGRHTLEQFSFELQKLIAQLQEHHVFGVQVCSLSFEPLDEKGQPQALWNERGEPVRVLEISAPPKPPIYRS